MSWDPVFRFVQRIPRGRVLTYGALAKALRLPGGARSAGRAMAATPSGKGIPWHRVVGERGKILIREPYASLQRKLLESEGITILESRVDLKRHLWKPPKSPHRNTALLRNVFTSEAAGVLFSRYRPDPYLRYAIPSFSIAPLSGGEQRTWPI